VTQIVAQDLSPKAVAVQAQPNTEFVVANPAPKPPKQDPAVIVGAVVVACSTTAMLLVLAFSDR